MRLSSTCGGEMYNTYLKINEENIDLLFVNAVVENLKYGIISLDAMFGGEITDKFDNDKYTFYFFHMQSVLTAQGNIWNVFYNNYYNYRKISKARVLKMRERLGVDLRNYPLVGNKDFRNTNEHFDDRYFEFKHGIGDYNIIGENTQEWVKKEILSTPHLRTIDVVNWIYYSYDRNKKPISMDLRELRSEMYNMLCDICTSDGMSCCDINNPRNRLLNLEI